MIFIRQNPKPSGLSRLKVMYVT